MAGVLGCFAFGVGSTDMANAWYTKDIRIRVPETVRYVLKGKKRDDVAAKDVMLVILASEYMKTSKGIGKVLEFAGEDLRNWPMDERATLTNMAVEAGGTTGIIEPDEHTLDYIVRTRDLDPEEVRKGFTYSDPDAEYAAVFEINLDEIRRWWPRRAIRVTVFQSIRCRRKCGLMLRMEVHAPAARWPTWTCMPKCSRALFAGKRVAEVCVSTFSSARKRSNSTRGTRVTSRSSNAPVRN